jgi:hypothetical protein
MKSRRNKGKYKHQHADLQEREDPILGADWWILDFDGGWMPGALQEHLRKIRHWTRFHTHPIKSGSVIPTITISW